jgi:hypothetical protein
MTNNTITLINISIPPGSHRRSGSLCAVRVRGRDYVNIAMLLDVHELGTPLKST